jgi:hypothetical protein
MALYDTLPVYKDVYALILLIYDVTKEFPREHKYTLGQDMKRDGMQLVRSIYRANKHKEKTEHLHQFQDDFELLKLEIRLCHDLHLINTKRYSAFGCTFYKSKELCVAVNRPLNGAVWQSRLRCVQE